jgi:energy-converting hydrogenase Eha subunit G
VLWIAAVLVAGAGIVVRVSGRRSRRGAHSIRS